MKRILENKIRRRGFATDIEARAHVDLYFEKHYITEQERDELYEIIEEVYHPVEE